MYGRLPLRAGKQEDEKNEERETGQQEERAGKNSRGDIQASAPWICLKLS